MQGRKARCDAWGKVVMDGGPYDEADEADRKELIEIRTEESKANQCRTTQVGSEK